MAKITLLKEFSSQRNVDRYAVAQYIRRHRELFEGHTEIKNNKMYIDDEGVELLGQKYPMPKPVYVVNGVEPEEHQRVVQQLQMALESLQKAQDERSLLMDRVNSLEVEISENRVYLEDKNKEVENLLEQKNEWEERAKQTMVELKEVNNKLEKLKNRSFLERLFNKS